jgi:hypothetical protein
VVRRNKPDRNKENHMPTYSIDSDNNLAVHPDKDAAIKEAGATGAAFATEAELSQTTASWPASRMVEVWNSFAGAPPFAELKEVKRFTDRKSAVARIWNAAKRLGAALEEEMNIAEQDMLRAQQEMLSPAKAAKPAKIARTPKPKAPAKPKATKDATSTDSAPAPKQREGTRKSIVISLLERAGGATLEEIMAATLWQKHSVRGFISILGSKHGLKIVSTRREAGVTGSRTLGSRCSTSPGNRTSSSGHWRLDTRRTIASTTRRTTRSPRPAAGSWAPGSVAEWPATARSTDPQCCARGHRTRMAGSPASPALRT